MTLFSILVLSCVYLSISVKIERDSIHTAISSMIPLMESHSTVINKLEDYLEDEENKLNIISTYLQRYVEEINQTVIYDTLNPLNAFILIKGTTRDIDAIQHLALNTKFVLLRVNKLFPREEELKGACTGVYRIQEAYDIDTMSLVRGEFRGMKLSSEMTVDDCYELGSCLYRSGEFGTGIEWFIEAYEGYRKEDRKYLFSFTESGIISQISFGYNTLNNSYEALVWLKKLLEIEYSIEAEYEAYKEAISHYEKLKPYAKNKTEGGVELKLMHDDKFRYISYKKACNNETKVPKEITKRLKCSYLTNTHPFLKIAPIKREQLYIDPDLFLFYDLIHEEETRILKIRVLSELTPSILEQRNTGELSKSVDIRICRSAWAHESELTDKIEQRIEDCTGLNTDISELLQVTNYGVAGYFTPHFDYFDKNQTKKFKSDRHSTFIFYMTGVIEGATVFPEIGLKVNPKKGSMLYFDNLLPTGEGDPRTLHAGCPIIKGDKWIAVKWLHTPGQELHRKCSETFKPVFLEVPEFIINGYPGVLQRPRKKK